MERVSSLHSVFCYNPMRTYKMYFSGNASANNACSLQIARSGRVQHVRWAVTHDCSSDNSSVIAELSMQAVSQIGVNNTIGVLDEIRSYGNFTTSGQAISALNIERQMDMPVQTGESLYVNVVVAGTAGITGTVFIDVKE